MLISRHRHQNIRKIVDLGFSPLSQKKNLIPSIYSRFHFDPLCIKDFTLIHHVTNVPLF